MDKGLGGRLARLAVAAVTLGLLLPSVVPAACLNLALLAETKTMRLRLSSYDGFLPAEALRVCAQRTQAQDHSWTFLPARVAAQPEGTGWPGGLPQYVNAHPEDYFARKALADQYLAVGQLPEALALLVPMMDANSLFLMGRWAREAGDEARALRYSQLAVTLAPEWSEAWYQLAEIQFHTGEAAALESYRTVLRHDPEPRLASATHVRIGNLLARTGDAAGAQAEFELALALDPQSVSAMEQLGRLGWTQGDLAQACAWAQRAERLDPDQRWVVELLAELAAVNACIP